MIDDLDEEESCPVCGFEISDHDADPIGAGLTQYTCLEENHGNRH